MQTQTHWNITDISCFAPVMRKGDRVRFELSQGPSTTAEMTAILQWEPRTVSAWLCQLVRRGEVEVIREIIDFDGRLESLYSLTVKGTNEVKRRNLKLSDTPHFDDTFGVS